MSESAAGGRTVAGEIYDLGYQGYAGLRLGRANAIGTLMAYSLRTAFGIGRGAKAKLLPFGIGITVFVPAVVGIAASSITGQLIPVNYNQHLEFTAALLALFAAGQAPELVVTDRQHGVLSLYLARPIHATDYVIARLGALVVAMLALTLGPLLLLFLGKVLMSADPWTALLGEWPKLAPIAGGSLGTSFFLASLGLALSSLVLRRGLASALVVGAFLIASAATGIYYEIASPDLRRYAVLVHPVWLMSGFSNWLFDIESGVTPLRRSGVPGVLHLLTILGVGAVATAALLARYRKGES